MSPKHVREHPSTPPPLRTGSLTSFHLALDFSFSNRRYSRRSNSSVKSRQISRSTRPMRATPATVPPTISAMLGGSGHSAGQTDGVQLQPLARQRGRCGRAGSPPAEGQKEQGWGTFFRIDSDGVNLLAVLLDHAEGDPAVLGVLLPALSAHPCQLLGHLDVRAGLGAVLLEGATQERLALHAGAAKQAATAHPCRGRGPLTWLWLWLGSAQAQAGLACPCPGGGGIPRRPHAVSACVTHMYLPQGEGQPGQSWQKGGWYPSRHWQRLQWQVPRWLHSLPRMFKQPSVDFLHWQALPWYPGVHLHSPQSHFPRSAGGRPFRPGSYRERGHPPSARAWRASPTLHSACHPPWDG